MLNLLKHDARTFEVKEFSGNLCPCPADKRYNRNALAEEFLDAINAAAEQGHHCAILFFDIDFYKKINDTHGHNARDIVLKEFIKRIDDCKRDSDLCCCLGGEEFIVLMPNVKEIKISHFDLNLFSAGKKLAFFCFL